MRSIVNELDWSVSLYARIWISQKLHKIFVHVACGSVLLSGGVAKCYVYFRFVNDVTFSSSHINWMTG